MGEDEKKYLPHWLNHFFSTRGFDSNGPDLEGKKGDGDERD